MDSTDEHDDNISALQEQIRRRRAALDETDPNHPDYDQAAADVLNAALDLVRYGNQVPALRAKAHRERAVAVAEIAGGGLALTAGLAIVCMFIHWVSPWWLFLFLPLLATGVGTLGAAKDTVRLSQAVPELGAGLFAGSAVAAVLGTIGVYPVIAALGALVLAAFGTVFLGLVPAQEWLR